MLALGRTRPNPLIRFATKPGDARAHRVPHPQFLSSPLRFFFNHLLIVPGNSFLAVRVPGFQICKKPCQIGRFAAFTQKNDKKTLSPISQRGQKYLYVNIEPAPLSRLSCLRPNSVECFKGISERSRFRHWSSLAIVTELLGKTRSGCAA